MQCIQCLNQAVIDQPARCKEHFIAAFEQRVRETIDEHSLIKPGDRIAVAVSGGKDSLTVLTLVTRWFDNVTAIAIDEGINGYREHTLADVRKTCDRVGVPLVVRSYKDLTGMTLDEMMRKRKFHPCTVCGTLRRHLLNVASKEFDVLVTGHNADDEAQAVLMNIVKGNTEIFPRLGPTTGSGAKGFTRRVKPLYFCTEKEVMTYAFLTGLLDTFVECPNIGESYRHLIRDELNSYAQSHQGVKERVLKRFLKAKQAFGRADTVLMRCEGCGEPSSKSVCKACTYIQELAKA
jgi:uncharacterized protein (TIGR00269 family)